jgi:phospholipase/carboxylesterase
MADLDTIEVETGPSPTASIIWMHGLGADGHDFEPIVPEIRLSAPVRYVFPHAPQQPVTINHGMVMRAWYDVTGRSDEDDAGLRRSQQLVESLVAAERGRGVPARRIVLAGFSQGGAMALQTGLRHTERLAGIMALSCYVPLSSTVRAEANPASRDVPIFMAHGTYDQVIPVERAEIGRNVLVKLGYRVEWHTYPMPHSVCAEEIADISAWLDSVLARSAD